MFTSAIPRAQLTAAFIRRLHADGLTERQIANLGVEPFVVEKVLRVQKERSELRKCAPAAERKRA